MHVLISSYYNIIIVHLLFHLLLLLLSLLFPLIISLISSHSSSPSTMLICLGTANRLPITVFLLLFVCVCCEAYLSLSQYFTKYFASVFFALYPFSSFFLTI